eukprot:794412-Pelagomonas_calceolata.AAC.4
MLHIMRHVSFGENVEEVKMRPGWGKGGRAPSPPPNAVHDLNLCHDHTACHDLNVCHGHTACHDLNVCHDHTACHELNARHDHTACHVQHKASHMSCECGGPSMGRVMKMRIWQRLYEDPSLNRNWHGPCEGDLAKAMNKHRGQSTPPHTQTSQRQHGIPTSNYNHA